MLPEKITYLCILFTLFGGYHYVKDVLLGKTKPNLVSWFFWGLAPIITGFLQLQDHVGLSVIPVFLSGFISVLVLITATIKRNAYFKITQFDIWCGIFSLISLVLWFSTRKTGISVFFAIVSDAFAAIPTLIKVYKFPETEHFSGYIPGILNHILGLLVITNWIFSIYAFSFYLITLNSIIIFLIYRKKLTSIFWRTFGRA